MPLADYLVTVVTPADHEVSAQDQGGNDNTDSDIDPTSKTTGTVTIVAGQQNLTVDAGLYKTASLGDRVWLDANGNGVQDNGEVGKAGVTVELYKCVNNAASGPAVATTITADGTGANPLGYYNFAGLVPGDYIVKFIAPNGSVLSTANVGNDAFDSDAGANGFTGCYTLASGQSNTTVDAGLTESAQGVHRRPGLVRLQFQRRTGYR